MGVAKVKHDGNLLGTRLGTSLGYQDGTETTKGAVQSSSFVDSNKPGQNSVASLGKYLDSSSGLNDGCCKGAT